MKVIEGRAGTGKSYTLGAIRDAYESAGYEVRGLAHPNKVVQALKRDGFKHSATLTSEFWALKHGRAKWDHRTVLIVDEAAMVDSERMGTLLAEARKTGAKVILAGDDKQLTSIERGGMFSQVAAVNGSVEITDVQRQKGWQKQASEDMAAGAWGSAVQTFDRHGAITWAQDDAKAKAALVAAWARDAKARPDAGRFVIAYTNRDVDALNSEIRQVRIDRGELGGEGVPDQAWLGRVRCWRSRAVHRPVQPAGIVNGTVGTITSVAKGRLSAQMDDGKAVTWRPSEFTEYRHGYAGTVYKSQGETITSTYLLHTRHWHSTSSYVALTRQSEHVAVFVNRQTAVDVATLSQQMGRSEERGSSLKWHTIEDVPRLQAAAVAHDPDVQKAQGMAARLIGEAYRDMREASEKLTEMVDRHGWKVAAAEVEADPTVLGALEGRDGFFSGKGNRERRAEAVASIDKAIRWVDRMPEITARAVERRQQDRAYSERAEEVYAERDAGPRSYTGARVAAAGSASPRAGPRPGSGDGALNRGGRGHEWGRHTDAAHARRVGET